MTQITWRPVVPEEVVLEAPTLRYRDDLPLSDIVVAKDGPLCCARRVPHKAEVLVWPQGLDGPPVSWTGPPGLSILRIVAFDGMVAYAFSERELLRISPGNVETLHRALDPIRDARLSPDAEHVLWLEAADTVRGYVARIEDRLRPTRLRIEDYCYGARWLDSEKLVALELHHVGEEEAGQSAHICDLGGEVVKTLFYTEAYGLQLGPVDSQRRRVLLFGYALPGAAGTGRAAMGAWDYDIDAADFRCLANATPAGGTATRLSDGCLFADSWAQTSQSSALMFASPRGCRAAPVAAAMREFAVVSDGRGVLFGVLGQQCGIGELAIQELVAASEAA